MSRLALVAATAVATLAAASPAAAIDPATPATPASTTLPGTTRVVDEWKLVGRGNPSAVQVAPRWVIGSEHAPMAAGSTFTNGYGAAVVQSTVVPACGRSCFGTDLSLSLLSTPINAPAYPQLLGENVGGNTAALPGSVLSAGYGKTDGPAASVGWTKPDGSAVAGQAIAPGTWGGDSGGASFWYPTPVGAPVLASILINFGGLDLAFQQNLVDTDAGEGILARTWLQRELAKQPSATPPTFVNAAGAVNPAVAGRPDPARGTWLETPGASSVRVTWSNAAFGAARTGYKVYVNGTLKTTLGASATTVKLTGLSWLTNYTVRVVATGPSGDAQPSLTLGDTVSFRTRWLF